VAVHALGFYLEKAFLPLNLSPFYPLPLHGPVVVNAGHMASLVAAVLITMACIWKIRKMPLLASVWVYFVVTLLPTLGIVQVGAQAAADRYMYLPLLGPLLLAGAGIAKAWESRLRVYLPVAALVVVSVFAAMTVRQTGVWKSTGTLWERVMEIYPGDSHPYAGLALAHMDEKNYEEALGYIMKAIEMEEGHLTVSPKLHWLYNIRADVHMALARHEDALRDFSRAVALNPNVEAYYFGRAKARERLGRLDEAIADYRKAVSLKADYIEAYNDLGVAYRKKGEYEKSVGAFDRAIALSPSEPGLYLNRGNAYAAWGRADMALEDYRRAARMGYGPAREYLRSIGAGL
jgi:tetratricopeptide (TPR) repeat protein